VTDIYEAFASGPVTVAESGKGGDNTIIYQVTGTTSKATASALVRVTSPLAVIAGEETLVRQKVATRPLGLDIWESTVSYGPEDEKDSEEPPVPGTWKFGFNTTGARHTITKSKSTKSRHWRTDQPESPAPDLKGAINFDGKKVRGVEVPVPNGQFHITAYYHPAVVTTGLMRNFMRKTPRTNTDSWLGFDPFELTYLGTEGDGDMPTVAGQRVQPIALKHHFDASENRTNIEPLFDGHEPAAPASLDAKGSEYLWYRYADRAKDNQAAVEPVHAYVETIHDAISFQDFFGFGD
jgi:hypothetical protein